MPVYVCRWPDGDCTIVSAGSNTLATERLNEVGNANGCAVREVHDLLVALTLSDQGRLELDHGTEWGIPVVADGPRGGLGGDYPILAAVRRDIAEEANSQREDTWTDEQWARIKAAVNLERHRLRRGRSG
jgi:hypothetical protein